MKSTYNILGISGSLREASMNTLFLRAMGRVCPKNINFEIYSSLDAIPPFNADNEDKNLPEVSHWRNALSMGRFNSVG
ncbi:hypothetical protein Xmau_00694 [Xenorhabdus mauleonii]|uniref:NADPH-dependent FMN reductase n=1 Tax=Xenorhabdus mauleonii TaxID=351675 RepID=A0A1I3JQR8_9GAMM|nr:NAD(P)H-dependent oxidoreductase [Xenorhabdus mauleonii]PHM46285.1 hypothetical protein Xmau_00694 [Xenorhabdus mauleonii]SFI62516.1 hypothetical protein SAMN05421680_102288 [Xenorhabdus mauleonii]